MEGDDGLARARGQRVREGAMWIGVLSVLFMVWGPVLFGMRMMEADQVLERLKPFADDEPVTLTDGTTRPAGELRFEALRRPNRALIANFILAGLMAVLWVWARRAPLPAMACALALFVVVHVGDAIIEPSTIYQGIIVKVLALAALGKGVKAALAARMLMSTPTA
jgi:hypothetical protein